MRKYSTPGDGGGPLSTVSSNGATPSSSISLAKYLRRRFTATRRVGAVMRAQNPTAPSLLSPQLKC